jgi:hypothetical protein
METVQRVAIKKGVFYYYFDIKHIRNHYVVERTRKDGTMTGQQISVLWCDDWETEDQAYDAIHRWAKTPAVRKRNA